MKSKGVYENKFIRRTGRHSCLRKIQRDQGEKERRMKRKGGKEEKERERENKKQIDKRESEEATTHWFVRFFLFLLFHFFPYSPFLFALFLLVPRPLPLHGFVETKRNPEDVAGCPTMGVPMSWYFEALRNPFPLFRTMLLPLLPRFVSWFQGRPGGGDTEGPVVPRNQSLSLSFFLFFFHSFLLSSSLYPPPYRNPFAKTFRD